jgi:1-acyl-sn-glycerol-3-phosphate acyltransferase
VRPWHTNRTGRTPSFIIAEVSLKRKVIAFFAKILRCVPIHRPRDVALAGEGTIQSDGTALSLTTPASVEAAAR